MAELTPVSHARRNHSNLPGPLGTAHLHTRPKDQAGDHTAFVGCEPAHRQGDRPRGLSVLIGNSDCFRAARKGMLFLLPSCRNGGGSCYYHGLFFGMMAFADAAAAVLLQGLVDDLTRSKNRRFRRSKLKIREIQCRFGGQKERLGKIEEVQSQD